MTMGDVFISSKSFKTCENKKSSVTFSKAVQRAAMKPFLGCFWLPGLMFDPPALEPMVSLPSVI